MFFGFCHFSQPGVEEFHLSTSYRGLRYSVPTLYSAFLNLSAGLERLECVLEVAAIFRRERAPQFGVRDPVLDGVQLAMMALPTRWTAASVIRLPIRITRLASVSARTRWFLILSRSSASITCCRV
jgi:hypothetical protein